MDKKSLTYTITIVIVTVSSYLLYRSITNTSNNNTNEDDNNSNKRNKRSLGREKYSSSKVTKEVSPDYIVIGSGMAGLSCACILSRLGFKTLVLEQHNDVSGGGTHSFDLKGYRFDSGLHYTVPWSVPVFALTCGKKPNDVCQFEIMGEEDGTVDKIYLVRPNEKNVIPFNMKYKEKHIEALYNMFPNEKKALDEYMNISNDAMAFVKVFIALRLLPKYIQEFCWNWLVPKRIIESASLTAKELLPKLTNDKYLISLLSSMWIDTGARPDKATFMLTASVFRGVAMEGGCYPTGGSEVMMKELVPIIEKNNGQVLIRAKVKEILIENGRATGVIMDDNNNTIIRSKKGIISSCGYFTTLRKLLNLENINKFNIPELPVSQSAGFVMCNIGIAASAEEIDVTNTNTWHIPIENDGDCFRPIETFFYEPLSENSRIPAFITFPSMKDKEWSLKHPGKVSCQMLVMSDYSWFENFKGNNNDDRIDGYKELKDIWLEKCIDIFLQYFPKAKDKIEVMDISTPLTIENYLNASRGGAVGLDVTPTRFTDSFCRKNLDPVTSIPGLYITGQDTVLCGVTLAQLSGVITAFRMHPLGGVKILLKSILLGN